MRKNRRYLRTPHLLVDVRNFYVVHSERITPRERFQRNHSARNVGEIFLRWIPVSFSGYNVIRLTSPLRLSGRSGLAASWISSDGVLAIEVNLQIFFRHEIFYLSPEFFRPYLFDRAIPTERNEITLFALNDQLKVF